MNNQKQKDKGHDFLIMDLQHLLEKAEQFEYHDLKNGAYAAPKMALVTTLEALITKTKRGDYDNK